MGLAMMNNDGHGDGNDKQHDANDVGNVGGGYGADADDDGWSDANDAFPQVSSQHLDTDGDGYGDAALGFQPDACPETAGTSTQDRFGCVDSDDDGWSDANDAFPDEPTQHSDADGDGYGDDANGFQADGCPDQVGTSSETLYGCVDGVCCLSRAVLCLRLFRGGAPREFVQTSARTSPNSAVSMRRQRQRLTTQGERPRTGLQDCGLSRGFRLFKVGGPEKQPARLRGPPGLSSCVFVPC